MEEKHSSSVKLKRVERRPRQVVEKQIIDRRVDVYRKSNLGKCLISALGELAHSKKIDASLAALVLEQFDRSVGRNLPHTRNHLVFHAEKVSGYRLIADNWEINLQDVTFSTPYHELDRVDSCIIHAAILEDTCM